MLGRCEVAAKKIDTYQAIVIYGSYAAVSGVVTRCNIKTLPTLPIETWFLLGMNVNDSWRWWFVFSLVRGWAVFQTECDRIQTNTTSRLSGSEFRAVLIASTKLQPFERVFVSMFTRIANLCKFRRGFAPHEGIHFYVPESRWGKHMFLPGFLMVFCGFSMQDKRRFCQLVHPKPLVGKHLCFHHCYKLQCHR